MTIDTTKPVTVEGAGKKGEPQTTKVDIDEEFDTPHSWTAPKKVPKKPDAEAFRDAMGHSHHGKLAKEVPQLRAKHAELAQLTDDEIIAIRGYCGDIEKPEFAGMKDYDRINTALRNKDAQQLSILRPYIDLIESGLAKLPKHDGDVFRIMNKVDPDAVRKQYVKGGAVGRSGIHEHFS